MKTDLLLYIVDITLILREYIASVNQTLLNIKTNDKPTLMVVPTKLMLTNI